MTVPFIVISSSRAGVGKTTLAFNLVTALLQDGYRVGIYSNEAISFLQKREAQSQKNPNLKMPKAISKADLFAKKISDCTVMVVDVPTADNSEFADVFSQAHTLITIAQNKQDIDWQFSDSYLNLIWQTKKNQAAAGIKCLNWVVVKNNWPSVETDWVDFSEKQAKRFGFRCAPALENREVYAHIANGYGAADLVNSKTLKMAMDDVYARRELLVLADFMWQHK